MQCDFKYGQLGPSLLFDQIMLDPAMEEAFKPAFRAVLPNANRRDKLLNFFQHVPAGKLREDAISMFLEYPSQEDLTKTKIRFFLRDALSLEEIGGEFPEGSPEYAEYLSSFTFQPTDDAVSPILRELPKVMLKETQAAQDELFAALKIIENVDVRLSVWSRVSTNRPCLVAPVALRLYNEGKLGLVTFTEFLRSNPFALRSVYDLIRTDQVMVNSLFQCLRVDDACLPIFIALKNHLNIYADVVKDDDDQMKIVNAINTATFSKYYRERDPSFTAIYKTPLDSYRYKYELAFFDGSDPVVYSAENLERSLRTAERFPEISSEHRESGSSLIGKPCGSAESGLLYAAMHGNFRLIANAMASGDNVWPFIKGGKQLASSSLKRFLIYLHLRSQANPHPLCKALRTIYPAGALDVNGLLILATADERPDIIKSLIYTQLKHIKFKDISLSRDFPDFCPSDGPKFTSLLSFLIHYAIQRLDEDLATFLFSVKNANKLSYKKDYIFEGEQLELLQKLKAQGDQLVWDGAFEDGKYTIDPVESEPHPEEVTRTAFIQNQQSVDQSLPNTPPFREQPIETLLSEPTSTSIFELEPVDQITVLSPEELAVIKRRTRVIALITLAVICIAFPLLGYGMYKLAALDEKYS